MKKTAWILLVAMLLALYPVTPLLASEEGSGGYIGSGASIDNVAPVIEEGSLVVQIVDDEGVAWGWSASGGPDAGGRAAPYILKGEQLNIQVEVTDANGEADLTGMQVKMNLAPDISFNGTLVATTIDQENGISKGLYSGNLTADDNMATGKYDITIDVTDPAGATDTYDPAIYEPNADILRPALSLEVGVPSVLFPGCRPGDMGIMAYDIPVHLTPQAVIGDEHIPVVFTILQSGTDMADGAKVLQVGSIVWSTTSQIFDNRLTTGQQTIASGVQEGTTVEVYYWLNVPLIQDDGNYSGMIDYQYIAD